MITINVPYLDHSGKITPALLKAMANGATAERDPNNADNLLVTLSDEDAVLFAMETGETKEAENNEKETKKAK